MAVHVDSRGDHILANSAQRLFFDMCQKTSSMDALALNVVAHDKWSLRRPLLSYHYGLGACRQTCLGRENFG